jgi:hypothetical protein
MKVGKSGTDTKGSRLMIAAGRRWGRAPIGETAKLWHDRPREVAIDADAIRALPDTEGQDSNVQFHTKQGNSKTPFGGTIEIPGPAGLTVVSDIHDTIKESNVSNKLQLVLNAFFRPFRAAPGLPEVYTQWSRAGARFVYLSNSPHQLYRALADYLLAAETD